MELSLSKEDQNSDGQNSDASSKDVESLVDAATHALVTGSADHCVMSVQLISQLTTEINQVSESIGKKFLSKGRKVVRPFRDTRLFNIFQLSCTLLRTAHGNAQTLNFKDESLHALMTCLLELAQRCLTFNSRGTASNEYGDEMIIMKVPTSWRPAFLDLSTVQLFFDLYASLPATLSPMALSCLVQLASVRRDIFIINEERVRFLSQLVNGIRSVIQNPQGLNHSSNYHQFCRLVLRLRKNYQIDELVSLEHYPDAIQLIAQFTKESARKWQSAPKSICCLLSFWHNMVYYSYFMQSKRPHLLEMHIHDIVKVYISTYLESVSVVLHEGLEDPLDDVSVIQQLQMLLSIGRYEYARTFELLVQVFGQTAQRYQEVITAHLNHELQQHSMEDIAVLEGQLTWLVYIIISTTDRQSLPASSHDADVMDGDLVCRVLQLMNFTDSCLPGKGCEKWELALTALFQQLLKYYVVREVPEASGFYERLSQTLGLNNNSKILALFIQKINMNLKHWSHCEQVLAKTLRLMLDLPFCHNHARKLAKLDAVQAMMNNHTSEQFPFLATGVPVQVMRHRTSFYTFLGRLLILDLGEDEEKFTQFMIPITNALDNVKQLLAQAETPVFQAEEAKKEVIGLARDLRGLAHALDTPISCMMLFYWIYPTCTAIMIQSIEIWHHDPEVTTPVLKLFAELIYNRSSRLQFHASSSNGILLFQEASKIFSTYGSGILAQGDSIPKDQIYLMRLKGISICFSMLKVALYEDSWHGGRLRQFGGDALATALHTFASLLPFMPLSDLKVHPKLSLDYYSVLEILARDHMNFLSTLEPNVLLYILSSLSGGLSDRGTCNSCCYTLDLLLSYLHEHLHHEGETDTVNIENDTLVKLVQEHPSILQQMLATTLNIVMSEECTSSGSISQPLLALILLNKEYFGQLRQPTISQYAPDRQPVVTRWFDGLMKGIEPNLLSTNRNKFMQNLHR